MKIYMRRRTLLVGAGAAGLALAAPAIAQTPKLRFGVGPLLPNPNDTRTAYMPVFAHLAEKLGVDFELFATTDWAGMAVAMGSDQLDVAWMGPWGYVIANNATGCQAVATVKYDGAPYYHGIIVGRPDLEVNTFPDDTEGMSISFADVGSTTGWLIPTFYALTVWGIDPTTFWQYRDGATHGANEVAVASGQVDLATDFDRNRNAMIENGQLPADATKVVWQSEPLPNDAIAVPAGAVDGLGREVQEVLVAITDAEAETLLPSRYTGFVAASHDSYAMIENAGIAVGKIEPRS